MNYYIQGNAANADKIRAAFEKLSYDTTGWKFDVEGGFFYTHDGKIDLACGKFLINLIKTHPDYKELELPVEPKFKVGDWIVSPNGSQYLIAYIDKEDNRYFFEINEYTGEPMNYEDVQVVDGQYHLWTIADAKDGDVLATGNIICIFKKLDKDGYYIISPCIYTVKGGLEVIDNEDDTIGSCGFKPATKEDRELLFRKIKEAGYKWDADKKELLKKIQPHYDISNFKAGMPVLVRDYFDEEWKYVQFSHMRKLTHALVFDAGCSDWYQCIPFNEETKHLLGTTNPCDERFINW